MKIIRRKDSELITISGLTREEYENIQVAVETASRACHESVNQVRADSSMTAANREKMVVTLRKRSQNLNTLRSELT